MASPKQYFTILTSSSELDSSELDSFLAAALGVGLTGSFFTAGFSSSDDDSDELSSVLDSTFFFAGAGGAAAEISR